MTQRQQNISRSPTVNITARVTADLAKRLREGAYERGVSHSLLIAQAIERYLIPTTSNI